MAFVLIEGFDHYHGYELYRKGWSGSSFTTMFPGTLPFAQCQAASVIINNGLSKSLPGSYSDLVVGFAFKVTGLPNFEGPDVLMFDLQGVSIGITPSGHLYLANGIDANVATGPTPLAANRWYFVELHATATSAEVHLDGAVEIAPTASGYTTPWNTVAFGYQVLGGVHLIVDDLYVLETGTSPNTSFLGPSVVRTLYPDGDGTYTDFSPFPASATHFPRVNERLFDGDITYVADGTVGAKDDYKVEMFGDLAVYGAQLNLGVHSGDAVGRQIQPLIRQAGTDYNGATSTLGMDYHFYSWLLNQDPSGSDWTIPTINEDEFGIEVVG